MLIGTLNQLPLTQLLHTHHLPQTNPTSKFTPDKPWPNPDQTDFPKGFQKGASCC